MSSMSLVETKVDDTDPSVHWLGSSWSRESSNSSGVWNGTLTFATTNNSGLVVEFNGIQISLYVTVHRLTNPPVAQITIDDEPSFLYTLPTRDDDTEEDGFRAFQSQTISPGSHQLWMEFTYISQDEPVNVDYFGIIPDPSSTSSPLLTLTTPPPSSRSSSSPNKQTLIPSSSIYTSTSLTPNGNTSAGVPNAASTGASVMSSSQHMPTNIIAGSIAGGSAFIILILLGACVYLRRQGTVDLDIIKVSKVNEHRLSRSNGQVAPYLLAREHNGPESSYGAWDTHASHTLIGDTKARRRLAAALLATPPALLLAGSSIDWGSCHSIVQTETMTSHTPLLLSPHTHAGRNPEPLLVAEPATEDLSPHLLALAVTPPPTYYSEKGT